MRRQRRQFNRARPYSLSPYGHESCYTDDLGVRCPSSFIARYALEALHLLLSVSASLGRTWGKRGRSRPFSAFRIAILTRQSEHRFGRRFDPALASASGRARGGTLTSKNAEIRWRFGTIPLLLSYCAFSSVLPRPGAPSPFRCSGGEPDCIPGRSEALGDCGSRLQAHHGTKPHLAGAAVDRRAEKPASPKRTDEAARSAVASGFK